MKNLFIFVVLLLVTTAACSTQEAATPEATQVPATNIAPTQIPPATRTPIPTAAASPTPSCTEVSGRMVKDSYIGVIYNKEIPVNVYLPPCYESGKSFPTLYLLHGQIPGQEDSAQNFWPALGLANAADRVIAQGAPGFIVVMPLSPEPLFSGTDGGKNSYEREFLEGVMPHVEATYKVSPNSADTTIAGVSRGAIWALEIGMNQPQLFGKIIAISPALAVNHARYQYDPIHIAEKGPADQKFLLVAGDSDWTKTGTVNFYTTLTKLGFDVNIMLVPGYHEAKTWEPILPDVLEFASSK